MYSEYYGLREKPFSLLPDPDFLFLSQKHAAALNLLELAVVNQSAFCTISGEIGTGKTTLIRELLNRLDSGINVGLITSTHFTFVELLRCILAAYGVEAGSSDIVALHHQLSEFVVDQHASGHQTLLIVDEAQNLSLSTLEELRMLCNLNAGKDLLLQIILVGQRELREKIQRPELTQLAQRISLDYHLEPLDEAETTAYIEHRLTRAGGSGDLFDKEATKLIYRVSEGIPRLINRVCDMSLVYGLAENLKVIDANVIKSVTAGQMPDATMAVLAKSLVRASQSASSQTLSAGPETVAASRSAAFAPAHDDIPQTGTAHNKHDVEETGARPMQATPEQKPSVQAQHTTAAAASSDDTTTRSRGGESDRPAPETAAALEAAAEKAGTERANADRIAAEKTALAKTAIDTAGARLAAAEKAEQAKRAAENALAEKTLAKRKAAKSAAASRVAAETARAERVTADKAATEKDGESEQAAAQAASEKLSAETAVAEKAGVEKTAMEEAAVAKAAAEKALAERLAAEKAAMEVAAAADAAVEKARAERVAAEKAAAEQIAAAQARVEQASTEQATARRTAKESAGAEKTATEKSGKAESEAQRAAAEQTSAEEAAKATAVAAKQALADADASRAAAEKAIAEQVAAENAAATRATEEKLALAKVAANVAAAAKRAAEQATAVRLAAEQDSREKEAAALAAEEKALEAARIAAKQAAAVERGSKAQVAGAPTPGAHSTMNPEPEGHLISGAQSAGTRPPLSMRSLTGALVVVSVVVWGAVWLITGHGNTGKPASPLAAARDTMAPAGAPADAGHEAGAETAALEVSRRGKKPE